MDDPMKQLLAQAPLVFVLIAAIKILYYDAKSEREAAAKQREEMLIKLDDVTSRLARVERACGADLLPPVLGPPKF